MKKIVFATMLILAVIISAGCMEKIELGLGKPPEQTVHFDLSQYDSHGKLSCGRIWVTRTVSNWDTSPAKEFAYLDEYGNVIYDWTPVGSVYSYGDYVGALQPQDFVNNYARIIDLGFGTGSTQGMILIDRDGNELYAPASIYVAFTQNSNRSRNYKITNFDKEGYAYFVGRVWWDGNTEGDYGVYWMDGDGIHQFLDDVPDVLYGIERLEDGYHYIHVNAYTVLFDPMGYPLINFGEAAGIFPTDVKRLDGDRIEATFWGKDDEQYRVVVNYQGEFLTEPKLVG